MGEPHWKPQGDPRIYRDLSASRWEWVAFVLLLAGVMSLILWAGISGMVSAHG